MDRPYFTELDMAVLRVAEMARQAALIEQARRHSPPAQSTFLQRLLRQLFGTQQPTASGVPQPARPRAALGAADACAGGALGRRVTSRA